MNNSVLSEPIQPVTAAERHTELDVLRGMALLGVLLINLDSGFRGSLFAHILNFHTHAGSANHAMDLALAWIFEFKAFTLFSFLFGVGVGVQTQRVAALQNSTVRFLARRFAVLLAIGLFHMLFIWNGDILTLYAVCGFLLIPFVALPARWLALIGLAVIVLSPYVPFIGSFFPTENAMQAQATLATRVYATGSFLEIMPLRWNEAWHFITPLLLNSLPRTFGLMLLGLASWRGGLLRHSTAQRKLLLVIFLIAGSLGALMTTLELWSKETGQPPPNALDLFYPYSVVLMAFAYGAGLLLCFGSGKSHELRWLTRLLASTGRMALSNYLAQSVIFSLIFYGYGLGLFGRFGSAFATLMGLAVFAAQLVASQWWLRRFRFGPAEWLWRSLTYGSWQPLTIS